MMIKIPGEPKGKQRARFGNGHTYTPKQTVDYESLVRTIFLQSKHELLEGNVKVNIIAYYKIAKSTSKKQKALMLDHSVRPTKKPDLDNIAKIILDSLNKIAYNDDKQVVELNVQKYYSLAPRVEVEMEEI